MRVLGVGTPQSPARAGSAAQRDKPDEMLWLRQRPPRHLGVQMLVCSERPRSLARVEQREGERCRPPPLPPRQFPQIAKCEEWGRERGGEEGVHAKSWLAYGPSRPSKRADSTAETILLQHGGICEALARRQAGDRRGPSAFGRNRVGRVGEQAH